MTISKKLKKSCFVRVATRCSERDMSDQGPFSSRGGGTGPADPAAAGPKLNRNPQFKIFCSVLNTLTILINNESTNDTTYYLCKTIALLE